MAYCRAGKPSAPVSAKAAHAQSRDQFYKVHEYDVWDAATSPNQYNKLSHEGDGPPYTATPTNLDNQQFYDADKVRGAMSIDVTDHYLDTQKNCFSTETIVLALDELSASTANLSSLSLPRPLVPSSQKGRKCGVETKCRVFDFVIVATGHNCTPIVPRFNGMETFSGKLLHSRDYKV